MSTPCRDDKGIAIIVATTPYSEGFSPLSPDAVTDEVLECAYQSDYGTVFHTTLEENELHALINCITWTRLSYAPESHNFKMLSELRRKVEYVKKVYDDEDLA